jgi:hypothetical protein
MLAEDIAAVKSSNIFFREDSLITKKLSAFLIAKGCEYLVETLEGPLNQIASAKKGAEVTHHHPIISLNFGRYPEQNLLTSWRRKSQGQRRGPE